MSDTITGALFAPGASGVCIKFKRDELLAAVGKHAHVHMKSVTYLKLNEIRRKNLKVPELPFLKRHAFEQEYEFRTIYTSKADKLSSLDIAVPLSCIEKITLSPWMHPSLSSYVKRRRCEPYEGAGTWISCDPL